MAISGYKGGIKVFKSGIKRKILNCDGRCSFQSIWTKFKNRLSSIISEILDNNLELYSSKSQSFVKESPFSLNLQEVVKPPYLFYFLISIHVLRGILRLFS